MADPRGPIAAAAAREAARRKLSGSVGKGSAGPPAPPADRHGPSSNQNQEAGAAYQARHLAAGRKLTGNAVDRVTPTVGAAVSSALGTPKADRGRQGSGDTVPAGRSIIPKATMEAAKERQAAQGRNLAAIVGTAAALGSKSSSGSEAAAAREAREAAAKKLRGSVGTPRNGLSPPPSERGGSTVTPAEASTKRYPLRQSGQAKPESVPASSGAAKAKTVAASTPRKPAGRPKARGSVGAASNRDLPGKTTVRYSDGSGSTTSGPANILPATPKRDAAALRAGSKARFEEQKKIGAARLSSGGGGSDNVMRGTRSRWNSQNRNK